jgi:hypothetical protein
LILLLAEAFADQDDRGFRDVRESSVSLAVLVASFFLAPPPGATTTGFWSFYTSIRSPFSSNVSRS